MKILRIVVGICLILAVAWAVLLRARRGTESMAALRKFRYAHRGLYDKEAGIPENSLPAFSRAIARGFGAELDVHLLRDGTLAVFHDSDVKRCLPSPPVQTPPGTSPCWTSSGRWTG